MLECDMFVRFFPVGKMWSWEICCNGQLIKTDDEFLTQEMARRDANIVMTTVKRQVFNARKGYTTELVA